MLLDLKDFLYLPPSTGMPAFGGLSLSRGRTSLSLCGAQILFKPRPITLDSNRPRGGRLQMATVTTYHTEQGKNSGCPQTSGICSTLWDLKQRGPLCFFLPETLRKPCNFLSVVRTMISFLRQGTSQTEFCFPWTCQLRFFVCNTSTGKKGGQAKATTTRSPDRQQRKNTTKEKTSNNSKERAPTGTRTRKIRSVTRTVHQQ